MSVLVMSLWSVVGGVGGVAAGRFRLVVTSQRGGVSRSGRSRSSGTSWSIRVISRRRRWRLSFLRRRRTCGEDVDVMTTRADGA